MQHKKIIILAFFIFILSCFVYADDGYYSGLGACYGSDKYCSYGNDPNPLNRVGWSLGKDIEIGSTLTNFNITKSVSGSPVVADFDGNGYSNLVFVSDGDLYSYEFRGNDWYQTAIFEDYNLNGYLAIMTLDSEVTPQDENCSGGVDDYILAVNSSDIFIFGISEETHEICTVYNSTVLRTYDARLDFTIPKCLREGATNREYCIFKALDYTNDSFTNWENGRLVRLYYDLSSHNFNIGSTTKASLNNSFVETPAYSDIDQDGLYEVILFTDADGNLQYGISVWEINSYSGAPILNMDTDDLIVGSFGFGSYSVFSEFFSNELDPVVFVVGTTYIGQYEDIVLYAINRWGTVYNDAPFIVDSCDRCYYSGFYYGSGGTLVYASYYDNWYNYDNYGQILISSTMSCNYGHTEYNHVNYKNIIVGDDWTPLSSYSLSYSGEQAGCHDHNQNGFQTFNYGIGGLPSILNIEGLEEPDLMLPNGKNINIAGVGNITSMDAGSFNFGGNTNVISVEANGDGKQDFIFFGSSPIKTYMSNAVNNQPHLFGVYFDTCSPVCVNNNITFSPNAADDEGNAQIFGVDCNGDGMADNWDGYQYTGLAVSCNYSNVGHYTTTFYLTDDRHATTFQTLSVGIEVSVGGNCYDSGEFDSVCLKETIPIDQTNESNDFGINRTEFLPPTDDGAYHSVYFDWGKCSGYTYMRGICPLWIWFKESMLLLWSSFWAFFVVFLMLFLIIAVIVAARRRR